MRIKMNRIACLFVGFLMAISSSAFGMNQANTPPKFPLVWGSSASSAYIRSIPSTSQIGIMNCAASLPDGFPPLTFTPAGAGGCPPFGQDFNGILKQITQWSQWYSAGAPIYYDATFATGSAAGYPKGAIVQSSIVAGDFWLSQADGNTTNPDTGGANWVPLPGMAQTGAISFTVTASTVPSGWVAAKSSYTIGSAASAANYASADAALLYAWLWNNFSNTQCPVSTGRGANAAADFAANKTIQVLDLSGTGLIGNDNGTNRLGSVPAISGTINVNGSLIGENLHTLVVGEIPSHTHNVSGTTGTESVSHTHASGPVAQFGASATGITSAGVAAGIVNTSAVGSTIESAFHTHTFSATTDGGTGGGGSHNNVERSMIVLWILKL
jgi:microcystin-dependent protein